MVQRIVGAAGIALVLLAGIVAARHAGTLLVVSQPLPHPDAIISLASHEWERLPETAALAARYPDARVLLTLPQRISQLNCHDCGGRVARLARMGVGADRIEILPLSAPGTYGEALACRTFAMQTHLRALLVVTSPYHTRRALATFNDVLDDAGVQVGIQAASATSPADPARWWRAPYDRWYVAYEWLAMIYYATRYGVRSDQ
jgi:uncharacterized SAM-binding protein YcdF (DUF218 family)